MTSRRKLTALCRILVPLIIVLAFHPVSSQAQATSNPPGQISYQGFLVDANGMPLATNAPQNYDVIIRIYNQPTGSTNSAMAVLAVNPAIRSEVATQAWHLSPGIFYTNRAGMVSIQ